MRHRWQNIGENMTPETEIICRKCDLHGRVTGGRGNDTISIDPQAYRAHCRHAQGQELDCKELLAATSRARVNIERGWF
jgi:hypothetical protein